MRCPICRSGETKPGTANFHYDEGEQVVVVRNVPAEICSQCGEAYFGEEVLDQLHEIVRRAKAAGIAVAITEYKVPVAA